MQFLEHPKVLGTARGAQNVCAVAKGPTVVCTSQLTWSLRISLKIAVDIKTVTSCCQYT